MFENLKQGGSPYGKEYEVLRDLRLEIARSVRTNVDSAHAIPCQLAIKERNQLNRTLDGMLAKVRQTHTSSAERAKATDKVMRLINAIEKRRLLPVEELNAFRGALKTTFH